MLLFSSLATLFVVPILLVRRDIDSMLLVSNVSAHRCGATLSCFIELCGLGIRG